MFYISERRKKKHKKTDMGNKEKNKTMSESF